MSKVLLVDDEPRILLLLQSLLKTNKYEVETARDGNAALDIVRAGGIDIMITDLRMTPMDGMTLFQEVHKLHPSMPVILLTAYASVETAIEAMKQGMFDYLTKPFKVDDILACLARAEEKVKKHESVALSMDIDTPLKYRFENLIGSSPLMTQVCDMIQKVAPTAATVLINGESGTGKEVGHMKGSFTGAYSDKQGLFEVANGGTLFLDEISSMPLLLQGKLLRVLQEREIRRVGGTKNIPVDVRVIAASNTNLEQAVVKGTFRSDLYYRFAVITIDIPPLRERKDDIIPLARHFIRLETPEGSPIPTIAPDTAEALMAYSWPGNVRELENAIKHALTFMSDGDITPDLLPPKILQHARAATAAAAPADAATAGNASLKSFLKQKEKEYIEHILVAAGGDKAKAADALKVNLSTLYRKLSDDPKDG